MNYQYNDPIRLELARMSRPENVALCVVVPVYNEVDAIKPFFAAIQPVAKALKDQNCQVLFVFVNDGSADNTLGQLIQAQTENDHIHVVDLSRNFGKEAALTAGIQSALAHNSDVIVPIDVDLQDPPQLMLDMLAKWREGYQIVLARRVDRSTDHWLKSLSAYAFYRIFNIMSKEHLPENVGDYRLMDREVAQAIGHLNERGRMMKALMNWVGFSRAYIDFERQPRSAGRSAFNPMSLVRLATNGVLSFSTAPLRAILLLGLFVGAIATGYGTYTALKTIIFGIDVPGYASTLVIILFASALQLTTLGVVGEYIARLFVEVKARPNYLVAKEITPEIARTLSTPNAPTPP